MKQLYIIFYTCFFSITLHAADTSNSMQVAIKQLEEKGVRYENAKKQLSELISAYGSNDNGSKQTIEKLRKAEADALQIFVEAYTQAVTENTYQKMMESGTFSSLKPIEDFQLEEPKQAAKVSIKRRPTFRRTNSSAIMIRPLDAAKRNVEEAKQAYEKASNAVSELIDAYQDSTQIPELIHSLLAEQKKQALQEWIDTQKQYLGEYILSLRNDEE